MTKPLAETSPSTRGRILAALYLVVIIGGITAQAFISDRLVVCDDAAKTATNILANTSLYRLGFTIFMLEMVAQVVVSAMYYDLLKRISGTSRCFFELSGATNSTIGSYQIDYVNFRPNRATEWDSTPKRCSRASSLDAPLLGEGTTFLGGPAGAGVVFRLRVSDTSPPTVGPVTPYNIESGDFVDSPFDLTTSVTDNESPVISCQYTTDGGSTWNPATVSGSTPNFTCTKTGITGTTGQVLTLNMRATSAGGTSTGTVVIRTVDQAPVARGRNVTVPVVSSCTANASVDDGSFDPDGDPITISQSPPEPYPLGQTSVTLTVTDSKGISSQSIGKVTAVDAALPQVSGGASKTTLWPPNHHLIDVRFSYAAKDNCDANPATSPACPHRKPHS